MHRLFVAIRPPGDIRDLLIDAMADSPELRWVSDENLHVTLRFIGEVERPLADDIALALGRIRSDPFEIGFSGVGIFERRSGGALWAGVQPKAPIAGLAAKVERAASPRAWRRNTAPTTRTSPSPASTAPARPPPRPSSSATAPSPLHPSR